MKVLGTKIARIDRLILPGDIRGRMSSSHVKDLSASIDQIGILQLPCVRKSDKKLIYGADRVAATMLLDRRSVEVRLVECTDTEAKLMELTENAYRRHDPMEQARLLTELVAEATERYEAEAKEVKRQKARAKRKYDRPGRPVSPKTHARKEVAEALGVKADSVRRAEYRAKDEKRKHKKRGTAPIQTYGLQLEGSFATQVVNIQDYAKELAIKSKTIAQLLTKMGSAGAAAPDTLITRAKERLQDLNEVIRRLNPSSICPYCKGLPGYQEQCVTCLGVGWVSKMELENTPKELLREEHPIILVQGEEVMVDDILEPEDDGEDFF
jgi:ParB-like chromosome segregation protein Spo0J